MQNNGRYEASPLTSKPLLLSAVRVPEMDAGACFYGIPPADVADPKKIKIPLIYHFANKDDWCTPAKVNDLEALLKRSKSEFEFYRYEAQHAFMNESVPRVTTRHALGRHGSGRSIS